MASLSPTSFSGKNDLLVGNATTTLDSNETTQRIQKNDSPQHHVYTRYTTPRSSNTNSTSSYSEESAATAAALRRSQNLKTMISNANAQETQMNTRISGLIADVKNFLEENGRVQERLSEDILALKA
mmetsp:Transcript_39108/g.64100  ORF Transcript_39108/g.64100 Transcript_39108/m.64100 type:complete len:127 (-) Transcript_39108:26-406(-)